MKRQSHDSIREVEGFLHTVPVVDVYVYVQHPRVVPATERKRKLSLKFVIYSLILLACSFRSCFCFRLSWIGPKTSVLQRAAFRPRLHIPSTGQFFVPFRMAWMESHTANGDVDSAYKRACTHPWTKKPRLSTITFSYIKNFHTRALCQRTLDSGASAYESFTAYKTTGK